MRKKLNKIIDPQLNVVEQLQPALALSSKIKLSLYKKSSYSGIPVNILEEVYRRGYSIWNEKFKGTKDQFAFDRVNSFIAGGFAADLDRDLMEADVPTPSVNVLAKKHKLTIKQIQKLVKSGQKIEKEHTTSDKQAAEIARDHLGERPDYYKKLKRYVESTEPHSNDRNNPNSRFDGSDELVDVYKDMTPGQKTIRTIKKVCGGSKS